MAILAQASHRWAGDNSRQLVQAFAPALAAARDGAETLRQPKEKLSVGAADGISQAEPATQWHGEALVYTPSSTNVCFLTLGQTCLLHQI